MPQLDGNIAPLPEYIRLECIKLAHRHDHTAAEVVDRAKLFEQYVQGGQATGRAGRQQKANNP